MALSPKFKQQLKGRAHALKPVVFIGQQGLSEAVLKEVDNTLNFHELIKVRVQIKDREERRSITAELCQGLAAEAVQLIGNIAIIYRKNNDG